MESLDTIISQYYDEEMNDSELLNYEARLANSLYVRDYTNEQCFEYYKITNSIKMVKNRISKKSENFVYKIEIKKKKSVFINIYSIIFKRLNKCFCNFFLNIWRNNS